MRRSRLQFLRCLAVAALVAAGLGAVGGCASLSGATDDTARDNNATPDVQPEFPRLTTTSSIPTAMAS